MAADTKQIYVYEHWSSAKPRLLGCLFVDRIRGEEHFSFEYDTGFLRSLSSAFILDPELYFYQGRQYSNTKQAFGVFADSAPDRWGRMLLNRREQLWAAKEGRKPRKLNESDYLLGVYDKTRMGALRFSFEQGGTFLADDKELAVPPWIALRSLEEASREFEKDENALNGKWLERLIRPGSSLGGARPKANVQDVDGSLWIAKFPSKHDENNAGAWEKVVHDLAAECGLNVVQARLEVFSELGSTFLVKRFDRDGERRLHFASAMTVLGKTDGASFADGTSYLDLAAFIRAYGARPQSDLTELWKRIVFEMVVSNTDDHLRNHGFILTPDGWVLSPMFDVNPDPSGDSLSLGITEESNLISIDLAIESAGYYGISRDTACKLADEICSIVCERWERLAKSCDLSRSQIELMRPAFTESVWRAKKR